MTAGNLPEEQLIKEAAIARALFKKQRNFGIFTAGYNGVIENSNPKLADLWRTTPRQLLGADWLRMISDEHRAKHGAYYERMLRRTLESYALDLNIDIGSDGPKTFCLSVCRINGKAWPGGQVLVVVEKPDRLRPAGDFVIHFAG